jgi:heme exporter protein CcmD
MGPEPHIGFVWAAYAVTAIGLGGLILDTVLRALRWKAKAAAVTRDKRG